MKKIQTRPLYQAGDIVTTSIRKGRLFKITGVTNSIWQVQDAVYKYCDQSDVGNYYTTYVTMESFFYFDLQPGVKSRKISLNSSSYGIRKVEPQHIVDMIQKLNKLLVETWP